MCQTKFTFSSRMSSLQTSNISPSSRSRSSNEWGIFIYYSFKYYKSLKERKKKNIHFSSLVLIIFSLSWFLFDRFVVLLRKSVKLLIEWIHKEKRMNPLLLKLIFLSSKLRMIMLLYVDSSLFSIVFFYIHNWEKFFKQNENRMTTVLATFWKESESSLLEFQREGINLLLLLPLLQQNQLLLPKLEQHIKNNNKN